MCPSRNRSPNANSGVLCFSTGRYEIEDITSGNADPIGGCPQRPTPVHPFCQSPFVYGPNGIGVDLFPAFPGGRWSNDHNVLAARRCRVDPTNQVAQGCHCRSFVELAQLGQQRCRSIWAQDLRKIRKLSVQTVRRQEDDESPCNGPELGDAPPASTRSRWKETTQGGRQRRLAGSRQGGGERRRSRHAANWQAGIPHCPHQEESRVRQNRCAGVADQGNRYTVPELCQQRRHFVLLVVFVQALETAPGRKIQVRQQAAGTARVLGQNEIDRCQDLARPRGEIAEGSYRRCHDPQGAGVCAHAVMIPGCGAVSLSSSS